METAKPLFLPCPPPGGSAPSSGQQAGGQLLCRMLPLCSELWERGFQGPEHPAPFISTQEKRGCYRDTLTSPLPASHLTPSPVHSQFSLPGSTGEQPPLLQGEAMASMGDAFRGTQFSLRQGPLTALPCGRGGFGSALQPPVTSRLSA